MRSLVRKFCFPDKKDMMMTWVLLFIFFVLGPVLQPRAQIRVIETPAKVSFRGLSVVDDQVAWLAGNQGTVGRSVSGGKSWSFQVIPCFEKSDFRTLYAFDSLRAIVANAGSPGIILRTENGGKSWKEVFRIAHKDAFFDGVDFWDDRHGIMYGDPINGKLLLVRTSDGGKTWTKAPENERPVLDSGEASFAASGTNIRLWEKRYVAIATGGLQSGILLSFNRGKSWSKISVPILKGTESRGIFSLAVHDRNWLIVGGDYKMDTLKKDHVFYAGDGGKTWTFPQQPTGGYRECVEFLEVPSVVAVGPGGVDLSQDGGKNWRAISNQKGFHVVRKARKGKLVVLAGSKGLVGILE
jgi:photosystem II stability/assembly factor-like uncharacterized protein